MHLTKTLATILFIAVVALIAAHCQDDHPSCQLTYGGECLPCDPRFEYCESYEASRPGCDPDNVAPCPDEWFICTNDNYGGKLCEEQGDAGPPGDGWVCEEYGGLIECERDGGDVPGSESGWECTEYPDGSVVCRRHSYYPDMGGEEIWNCYYQGEFRFCGHRGESPPTDGDADTDADGDSDGDIPVDGSGECPPGVEIPTVEVCEDGIDNDCNGLVDDCAEDLCVCNEGEFRYCDYSLYCLWGTQECDASQITWGPCTEAMDIPAVCRDVDGWYSPRAEQCCVENGFCCHDYWDLDHDGDTWESLGTCDDPICVPPDSSSGSGSER